MGYGGEGGYLGEFAGGSAKETGYTVAGWLLRMLNGGALAVNKGCLCTGKSVVTGGSESKACTKLFGCMNLMVERHGGQKPLRMSVAAVRGQLECCAAAINFWRVHRHSHAVAISS